MDKYRSYVGMDVHARSITLASLDTETGEVSRGRLTGSPGAAEVSAWARERCGGEILLAYESGPTGFAETNSTWTLVPAPMLERA